MAPTIHIVRHAQGEHNLGDDEVPDPRLTPLGREQCENLQKEFPHMDKVKVLVASPMQRTIETCLLSFAPVAKAGVKVLLLAELQETGALPCDVGSPTEKLVEFFGSDAIDASRLKENWNSSKLRTGWAWPNPKGVHARARTSRHSLRDQVREAVVKFGDDVHIIVVTHGAFLHFLIQDYCGVQEGKGSSWKNTENRSYHFQDLYGDDDDATLVETPESLEKRRKNNEKFWADLSDEEKKQLIKWAEERVILHDLQASAYLKKLKEEKEDEEFFAGNWFYHWFHGEF